LNPFIHLFRIKIFDLSDVTEMLWLALRTNENVFLVAVVFDLFLLVDPAKMFYFILFYKTGHI